MSIEAKTENVSIRLGQTGSAMGGKLSIKFVEIVEDSRCPADATCVWAGNAKVRVQVSQGRSRRVVDINTGSAPKLANAFGYKISIIDLTPRPGEPHRMIAQPNLLKLKIEK